MTILTKLTLAFAAVALLPICVLGVVARMVIVNQSRAAFERTLDEATEEVERELGRLSDEVQAAAQRLARAEHPFVGALLVGLARGPLGEDESRDLQSRAEAEMRGLGLDVFLLLSDKGEVLAAGHFPGQVGERDPASLQLARGRTSAATLIEVRVVEEGRPVRRLAVLAGRDLRGSFGDTAAPRLGIVVGRLLGRSFLERLHPSARLLGPDGKLILSLSSAKPSHGPSRVVDLRRPDGTLAAQVALSLPGDELERTLELVTMATVGLGIGGLALALLFGAVLARRWSTPVAELADAAHRLARGDLGATVEPRGSDELGRLGRAWNGMLTDLRGAREQLVRAERIAAWRDIAQRIAHEIKNPLTPIQMAIETLTRAYQRRDTSDAFERLFSESAATILDEVQRLKGIVSEFSNFARMPAPSLGPLDVNEVVESALRLYATNDTPPRRELAPSLPTAHADRDQIAQVLINLLENARDAVAASGAAITVRTLTVDGRPAFEIADGGPGLSDETKARLFTPYFTTKPKGTGLGLAIVHRIVTDHGGEIRVTSTLGQGATFLVVLAALP